MKFRRGNYRKIILGLLLMTIIAILPSIMVVKGEAYQINSYLGPEPTIDGIVVKEERNAAGKPKKMLMPFDEWFMGGDQLPRDIEIGSIHTNTSKLYIYVKIYFDGILEGNISFRMRKALSSDYYDYKTISSLTNSSCDGYRIPNQWQIYIDTENNGTEDSVGKCFITDSCMTFELLMPYNSEDTNGHDLNIILNDEIEIYYLITLKYLETDWEPWNHYAWPNTDTWKIVFQTTSASPISLLGIIMGLMITPIILQLRKNRKHN